MALRKVTYLSPFYGYSSKLMLRVFGDGWEGWQVRDAGLVDPDGNVTTRAQLTAYWIIMQYAAELARDDRETSAAEGLRALLRRA